MAKISIPNITGSFASVTQINASFDSLEAELNDNVLYRTNPVGEPNSMSNDIDMSNNDILNAASVTTTSLVLNGVPISSLAGGTIPAVEIACPSTASDPAANEVMTFKRISDTSLRVSMRGADGTVRSVDLTLA